MSRKYTNPDGLNIRFNGVFGIDDFDGITESVTTTTAEPTAEQLTIESKEPDIERETVTKPPSDEPGRWLDMYGEYRLNIKAAGKQMSEILRGLNTGRDPTELLFLASQAISDLMDDNNAFSTAVMKRLANQTNALTAQI